MTNKTRKMPVSVSELAEVCGAVDVIGSAENMVTGFCSVTSLMSGSLTFVSQKKFLRLINADSDSFFIVKPEWSEFVSQGLVHDNPTQAFRLILESFCTRQTSPTISPSAKISSNANVGNNVSVGDYSVIESGAVIGDGCVVGNHCTIGVSAVIGDRSNVGNRVSILDDCQLGTDCVVGDGAIIGGQGFGFSFEGGAWKAIPQIGRVIIGNEVHIGNNTCIDRGAIDNTVIGDNVIVDNLVHIAHNVHIGSSSALAGAVGIAGSAVIGKHCMFGGQVGVAGHIEICDGVQVNGGSKILKSITAPGTYAGSFNVMPSTQWNRTLVYFQKLGMLFKREKKRE